jgi:hypothetical protein
VKSHAQLSKHVGRIAQRMERVAAEEEAAGHRMTARFLNESVWPPHVRCPDAARRSV